MLHQTLAPAEKKSISASERRFQPSSMLFVFACILLVCTAAYGGCFAVGLSSDDYDNIDYFRRMFDGRVELFFDNFRSSYLGNPLYGLHFRPLLQLPFIADFALWNTGAAGWHLSNFLVHILCSTLVYLVGGRLFAAFLSVRAEESGGKLWSRFEAGAPGDSAHGRGIQWLPLAAAALFAANPINTEAVNWIVGRVDSWCCLFVLLTLYCYLREGRFWRAASVLCFGSALGFKESALTIPAVLLALELFRGVTWTEALKRSSAYWIVLVSFFAVRQNALGAIVGGYSSVSETLSPYLVLRFFSLPAMKYYFLPVPSATLSHVVPQLTVLCAGYIGTLVVVGINLRQRLLDHPVTSLCGFLVTWTLLCLVPIAPVFLPHEDMTCNRWFYIPSVPVSLLMVAATMAGLAGQRNWRRYLGGTPLLFVLAAFIALSRHNTVIWQRGTDYCDSLNHAIVCFAKKSVNTHPLILGMPARIDGVYIHHLLRTLQTAVRPPFMPGFLSCEQASNIRFLEPNWFMEQGVINVSAVRRALTAKDSRVCQIVVKPDGEAGVEELFLRERAADSHFPDRMPSPVEMTVSASQVDSRVENRIQHITLTLDKPIEPLRYSQLVVQFAKKTPSAIVFLYLKSVDTNDFSSENSRTLRPTVQNNRMIVNVGELKKWSVSGGIDRICLSIPDAPEGGFAVEKVTLRSEESLVPKLSPGAGLRVEDNGVFAPTDDSSYVDYDASAVCGATGVAVEIDGEYHRFLYSTGTYRDAERSAGAKHTVVLPCVRGRFKLPQADKRKGAEFYWYPIRVFALGADGQTVGFSSDPLYVRLKESGK